MLVRETCQVELEGGGGCKDGDMQGGGGGGGRGGVGQRREDSRDGPAVITCYCKLIGHCQQPPLQSSLLSMQVCMCIVRVCVCVCVPLGVVCEGLTSWLRNLLFNKYSAESLGEEPRFVFPLTSVLLCTHALWCVCVCMCARAHVHQTVLKVQCESLRSSFTLLFVLGCKI